MPVPRGFRVAFVLYDEQADEAKVIGGKLARTRQLPASTFKIPNTLIALETGVVDGEGFSLTWDGTHWPRAEWNQDQTLATAIQRSVVWYYQEVARRIGLARMRDYVRRFGYGNQQVGDVVDVFWLRGPLAISPWEQVEFLRRERAAARGDAVPWALPVSQAHAQLLEKLIVRGERDQVVLRGKTGMAIRSPAPTVVWLVGFVDAPGRSWVYALLLVGPPANGDKLAAAREPLARALLGKLGVPLP